jgi:hypothetical protein
MLEFIDKIFKTRDYINGIDNYSLIDFFPENALKL